MPTKRRKPKKRQKVTDKVSQMFRLRINAQQKRLESLSKQVATIEEYIAKRQERAEEIVDRRVKELLGERDELSWDEDGVEVNPAQDPMFLEFQGNGLRGASIFGLRNEGGSINTEPATVAAIGSRRASSDWQARHLESLKELAKMKSDPAARKEAQRAQASAQKAFEDAQKAFQRSRGAVDQAKSELADRLAEFPKNQKAEMDARIRVLLEEQRSLQKTIELLRKNAK